MRAGKSEKNGAHLGGDAEPGISRAHRVEVLGARLLHDAKPRAQIGGEPLDCRRHDLGHHARALAAAEHQQAQLSARLRRGIGRRRRGDHLAAHRIAGEGHLALPERGSSFASVRKPVAIAVTRPASRRLARPMTPFCSCSTVGMPRRLAAIQRRHGRIAAEADHHGGADAAEHRPGLGGAEREQRRGARERKRIAAAQGRARDEVHGAGGKLEMRGARVGGEIDDGAALLQRVGERLRRETDARRFRRPRAA